MLGSSLTGQRSHKPPPCKLSSRRVSHEDGFLEADMLAQLTWILKKEPFTTEDRSLQRFHVSLGDLVQKFIELLTKRQFWYSNLELGAET